MNIFLYTYHLFCNSRNFFYLFAISNILSRFFLVLLLKTSQYVSCNIIIQVTKNFFIYFFIDFLQTFLVFPQFCIFYLDACPKSKHFIIFYFNSLICSGSMSSRFVIYTYLLSKKGVAGVTFTVFLSKTCLLFPLLLFCYYVNCLCYSFTLIESLR